MPFWPLGQKSQKILLDTHNSQKFFSLIFTCTTSTALAIVAVQGQRQGRRGGRRQGGQRQGRQEDLDAGYGAPQAEYGVQADASSLSESHEGGHEGLDWLLNSVPGTPGEDYPILAEVPETAFSCDGQVEGGKIRG